MENKAIKLFPYCCHFQITSVGTTIIINLSLTAIEFQIGHQVLIKLRTHKVCYEDLGNNSELFFSSPKFSLGIYIKLQIKLCKITI